MKILEVRNPKRTETGIELEVLFEEIGSFINYHATADDKESHGKTLYSNANAGVYGNPQVYIESSLSKLMKVREDAQTKILATDRTLMRCIKNDVQFPTEWKNYYKDLLAISRMSEWVDGTILPTQPPYPEGT